MSNDQLAFFIGLFGSLHCIGMCGPLMLAVNQPVTSPVLLFWNKFIYQAGRAASYAILGLMIGFIGKQLWLFGLQQFISIISGALIIIAASTRLFKLTVTPGNSFPLLAKPFGKLINIALRHRAGHFFIGMINGLLPCGFVYLALAAALNTGSATAASRFMFLFGLGTMPLMFIAAISSNFVTARIRFKLTRAMPYFMLFLGVWFVLRGLALNIPYLSPPTLNQPPVCHSK